MSITDLVKFIKGLGVTTPVYPLAFPASSPVEAMLVEFNPVSVRGSVHENTLTVTVRAGHPSEAERLSQDVIKRLSNLTNQTVGDLDFIMIKSQHILPSYLGKDAEGNHFYMNNFKVLASA